MNDELNSRLRRLQRIADVMRGLMREAEATAPASTRAKDTTGAVTITLDAEGIPLKITVAVDWRRRLGTRALGAAVMDANAKAATDRMKAWTQALHGATWARKVERMMATGPDDLSTAVPEVLRPRVKSRPLGDLSDEMIRALDRVEAPTVDRPRFHGINRRRTVAITLEAHGMTACQIENAWAARQSGPAVSAALAEALVAAKAHARAAARAEADRPNPVRAVDILLDEAMSLLHTRGNETEATP
jgi:hypothetical protein